MQIKISVLLILFFLFLIGCSTVNSTSEELIAVSSEEDSQQKPPVKPCTAVAYRHFDFWVGEWTVTTPDGQYAGKNSIKPILNGCALYESWTGKSGYRGDSINFYDAVKNKWHQTWIDFAGNALYGDGGLEDSSMVLSGLGKDVEGNSIINKISWTPNLDGSVRQHWEVSKDDGVTWATAFDGLYVKTSE